MSHFESLGEQEISIITSHLDRFSFFALGCSSKSFRNRLCSNCREVSWTDINPHYGFEDYLNSTSLGSMVGLKTLTFFADANQLTTIYRRFAIIRLTDALQIPFFSQMVSLSVCSYDALSLLGLPIAKLSPHLETLHLATPVDIFFTNTVKPFIELWNETLKSHLPSSLTSLKIAVENPDNHLDVEFINVSNLRFLPKSLYILDLDNVLFAGFHEQILLPPQLSSLAVRTNNIGVIDCFFIVVDKPIIWPSCLSSLHFTGEQNKSKKFSKHTSFGMRSLIDIPLHSLDIFFNPQLSYYAEWLPKTLTRFHTNMTVKDYVDFDEIVKEGGMGDLYEIGSDEHVVTDSYGNTFEFEDVNLNIQHFIDSKFLRNDGLAIPGKLKKIQDHMAIYSITDIEGHLSQIIHAHRASKSLLAPEDSSELSPTSNDDYCQTAFKNALAIARLISSNVVSLHYSGRDSIPIEFVFDMCSLVEQMQLCINDDSTLLTCADGIGPLIFPSNLRVLNFRGSECRNFFINTNDCALVYGLSGLTSLEIDLHHLAAVNDWKFLSGFPHIQSLYIMNSVYADDDKSYGSEVFSSITQWIPPSVQYFSCEVIRPDMSPDVYIASGSTDNTIHLIIGLDKFHQLESLYLTIGVVDSYMLTNLPPSLRKLNVTAIKQDCNVQKNLSMIIRSLPRHMIDMVTLVGTNKLRKPNRFKKNPDHIDSISESELIELKEACSTLPVNFIKLDGLGLVITRCFPCTTEEEEYLAYRKIGQIRRDSNDEAYHFRKYCSLLFGFKSHNGEWIGRVMRKFH